MQSLTPLQKKERKKKEKGKEKPGITNWKQNSLVPLATPDFVLAREILCWKRKHTSSEFSSV